MLLALLVQQCALLILCLFGWSPMSAIDIQQHLKLRRAIVVYNHTSNWEFVIMLLYACSCPALYDRAYFVVKPSLYRWLKLFSNHFVPATRLEDRNQGFVKRTSELFSDKSHFHLYIAPEGQRKLSQNWLPGYWKVAQRLALYNRFQHQQQQQQQESSSSNQSSLVHLSVMGLDFVNHKMSFGWTEPVVPPLNSTESDNYFQRVEKRLQQSASSMIPLFPEQCFTTSSHTAQYRRNGGDHSTMASNSNSKGNIADITMGNNSNNSNSNINIHNNTIRTETDTTTDARATSTTTAADAVPRSPTLFDYVVVTAWLPSILPLYCCLQYHSYSLAAVGFICACASTIYHSSQERQLRRLEPALILAGLLVFAIELSPELPLDTIVTEQPLLLAMILCSLVSFYYGAGRHCALHRTPKYRHFHPLFHCFVSCTLAYCLVLAKKD
jgi:hypothetical protein